MKTDATSRYKPYPHYKDSGVEWLGKIPEDWAVKPLKFAAAINSDVLPNDTASDFGFRYIDISSVTSTGSIGEMDSITFEHAPSRARRKVQTGDTIISTVRTYLKAIALIPPIEDNLIVSTGFAVLRPKEFDPRFLWRLVGSEPFIQTVMANSEGVGYPAISPSKLGRLSVWIPPSEEQQIIASFLDKEIAPIDALIARQRITEADEVSGRLGELMAHLENNRAALLTAAVTGAIDVRDLIQGAA